MYSIDYTHIYAYIICFIICVVYTIEFHSYPFCAPLPHGLQAHAVQDFLLHHMQPKSQTPEWLASPQPEVLVVWDIGGICGNAMR